MSRSYYNMSACLFTSVLALIYGCTFSRGSTVCPPQFEQSPITSENASVTVMAMQVSTRPPSIWKEQDVTEKRPFQNTTLNSSAKIGGCICPPQTFGQRYARSEFVVVGKVLRLWTSCKYCIFHSNPMVRPDTRFRIHTYQIYVRLQFKGKALKGKIIYAQAMGHPDTCGVSLRHDEYLLMLEDPSRTSEASHWVNPGEWFVLHGCEQHSKWSSVPFSRMKWLRDRP